MFNLEIQGTSNIMGIEVPNIFGGFGEGQKSVLIKDMAVAHNEKVFRLNELMGRNSGNFIEGVDYVDLKKQVADCDMFLKLGFTKAQVGNAKHIYLLSQMGYMKLVSAMDNTNPKKWDIMNKFITDYFLMVQIIQENPIERAMKRAIAEGTSQETLSVLTEEITKKTIKEVTPILIAEGVNKGIKQGYGQGYTQAELEGKSKLKRELNGQDRGYTYGALATEINKQYTNKNRIKITTTHITDYLLEEGYFEKLSFQAKSGGKLKFYSNGEPVMEKPRKQPTYKFMAEVVNTGCATTKEDFRGKVEVKLLNRFEDWFFDNHFNKFIDYIEKTYK